MTIILYLGGSLVAIGLLAGLLHVLGRSASVRLSDAAQARAIFVQDHPHSVPGEIAVSVTGAAALVALDDPRTVGVIRSMGDFWLTRRIGAGGIATVRRTDQGTGLRIVLTDFTCPAVTVRFADAATAGLWLTRLSALDEGVPHAA